MGDFGSGFALLGSVKRRGFAGVCWRLERSALDGRIAIRIVQSVIELCHMLAPPSFGHFKCRMIGIGFAQPIAARRNALFGLIAGYENRFARLASV
jgi:hypothetical protein